jgi:hypothetical protein
VYRHFPTASAAIEDVITRTAPTVIGFGEFHQQSATKEVVSAIERFTANLLPMLSARISDLVVETWISTGQCGETETKVTAEVDQVSDRPPETENETIRMIKQAAALGVQPHVLKLGCDDYAGLQGDGGVDYLKLLELVGERLGEEAVFAMENRASQKAVAIYGGAIHNDALPDEMWESVSFVPKLKASSAKINYVEIDLYVPEFIQNSAIAKNENWFPLFEKQSSKKEVLLIELGPKSYILVFKKGVTNRRR